VFKKKSIHYHFISAGDYTERIIVLYIMA